MLLITSFENCAGPSELCLKEVLDPASSLPVLREDVRIGEV